ncbi:MAG: TlpA family protein disulfide reductase, partial [Verrucomicrobiales bacterium]
DIQPTLAKENRTTNNYLFGGESKDALAEALDAEWRGGYPHTVLVAPGGKVLFRQTGEIQPIEIRKAIVNYLGRTYAGRQWGG